MTETAEHPTAPVARQAPGRARPNRVHRVLTWVGIVAGIVLVVGFVFFSGFFMGRHSAPAPGHFGSHHGRGVHFFHRAAPAPLSPTPSSPSPRP